MALRARRRVVGELQHRRPGDRVLQAARRARAAGARRRLRDRPAAGAMAPGRHRRRRLRRFRRHGRALPGACAPRGLRAHAVRPATARARSAAALRVDRRLRRLRPREHTRAGRRGAAPPARCARARRNALARQPGAVRESANLGSLDEARSRGAADDWSPLEFEWRRADDGTEYALQGRRSSRSIRSTSRRNSSSEPGSEWEATSSQRKNIASRCGCTSVTSSF